MSHHHHRYHVAKRVTLIGAFLNLLLGLVKILGGWLFHSHALVADGVHSFADLFTDFMVIFASKYGSQAADQKHPYGHKRIETATTFIVSLALVLAGAGIIWDAIEHVFIPPEQLPARLSLAVAGFSILVNEWLFYYMKRAGQSVQSELLEVNAWHHRSDAAASLVVLLGILGSLVAYPYLDVIAAGIVGLMIIQMGFSYGLESVKELIDTAVESELRIAIEDQILAVPGVKKIHQLRSRSMGQDVLVDVHIQVAPYLSVSEGHYIAQHVHDSLVKSLEPVQDVTVHIDPEDDEFSSPSLHLPNRTSLEQQLLNPLQKEFPALIHWNIHYLSGKIGLDLVLGPEIAETEDFLEAVTKLQTLYPYLGTVRTLQLLK